MSNLPTVGRIVHYVSHGSPVLPDGSQRYKPENRAAIITVVWSDQTVGLAVLNPTGVFFDQSVPYDADERGGSWHWPARG